MTNLNEQKLVTCKNCHGPYNRTYGHMVGGNFDFVMESECPVKPQREELAQREEDKLFNAHAPEFTDPREQ